MHVWLVLVIMGWQGQAISKFHWVELYILGTKQFRLEHTGFEMARTSRSWLLGLDLSAATEKAIFSNDLGGHRTVLLSHTQVTWRQQNR